MLSIGYDENLNLLYEGRSFGYGHAVWPAPVLSIATLIKSTDDLDKIPESNKLETKLVFREDSFDPVTRIRRGRLYCWQDGSVMPSTWRVQAHPARYSDLQDAANNGGVIDKPLYGWHAWSGFRELGGPTGRAQIALGIRDAFTLWRVVDIERIVTGEDLLTLRARGTFGLLPELNLSAVPASGRTKLAEVLGKLADAAHRQGTEAIVDRARDAAQWCLGVYLADLKQDPKYRQIDLWALASTLEGERLKSVSMLIARLHSRGKPGEQEKYDSRPVVDADADFALAGVGMLLRELGWAGQ